jgi:antagonist of KipI
VTHSGQLIILLADAQTTGGYPRIANVISVDQDKLAQMRPGDSFSFRVISLKEAYEVF